MRFHCNYWRKNKLFPSPKFSLEKGPQREGRTYQDPLNPRSIPLCHVGASQWLQLCPHQFYKLHFKWGRRWEAKRSGPAMKWSRSTQIIRLLLSYLGT